MNTLPISELRKITVPELQKKLPVKITADGKEIAILVDAAEVIIISDLHPAVQKQFKAKEDLVRKAMKKPDIRLDLQGE